MFKIGGIASASAMSLLRLKNQISNSIFNHKTHVANANSEQIAVRVSDVKENLVSTENEVKINVDSTNLGKLFLLLYVSGITFII